jgi:hypothetical protein
LGTRPSASKVLPDSLIVWPTRRQRAVRGDQHADQLVSPSTTRSYRFLMHGCPAPIATAAYRHVCPLCADSVVKVLGALVGLPARDGPRLRRRVYLPESTCRYVEE